MPDVIITPTEDGPYLVSGPVRLVAPDGHGSSTPIRCDVPLWALFKQAVLRRNARHDRLRRHTGELITTQRSVPAAEQRSFALPTGEIWSATELIGDNAPL